MSNIKLFEQQKVRTSWDAKEEMIKLINISAGHLPGDASALDLSQIILENCAKIDKMPTDIAIAYVKNEVHKIF